jgi:sugar (pentulose or hexulose) kinase
MDSAARAAVLDIGKTNIKLHAVTLDGAVAESLSTPNTVRDGPPWRHHDLEGTGGWALAGLSDLCRRHPLEHIIAAGHGSGGVLVGGDPDRPAGGAVLPMIDYEQALPPAVRDAYAPLAGSFLDRGSAIMQGATHQARQLLWMEMAEPAKFAAARWYLGLPQYWAWRFSGVAASEASLLGAQSQLWNTARRRFSPIVTIRGWRRLMPPMARASAALGPLRPELARRQHEP